MVSVALFESPVLEKTESYVLETLWLLWTSPPSEMVSMEAAAEAAPAAAPAAAPPASESE